MHLQALSPESVTMATAKPIFVDVEEYVQKSDVWTSEGHTGRTRQPPLMMYSMRSLREAEMELIF